MFAYINECLDKSTKAVYLISFAIESRNQNIIIKYWILQNVEKKN